MKNIIVCLFAVSCIGQGINLPGNNLHVGIGLSSKDLQPENDQSEAFEKNIPPIVSLPIYLRNLKLEPMFYHLSNYQVSGSKRTEKSVSVYALGIYLKREFQRSLLYYGFRAGNGRIQSDSKHFYSSYSHSRTITRTSFAAIVGGLEYFLTSHFSIGWELAFEGMEKISERPLDPESMSTKTMQSGTKARIILRAIL